MPHERFDGLREHLLRAGIAPRHVRRYVAELNDHFDELVREGTESGLTPNAAQQAARSRIGGDDTLSAAILARPGLRSVVARFPWAVFGLAPVLILALVVVAALVLQGGLIFLSPPIPPWSVPWARFSLDALNWLTTYAAPLVIAALLCIVGLKQRMAAHWIVLGISITCFVGGFHEIGVSWSSVPSEPSELQLSFALAPPYPTHMLIAGALRAAINLAIVSAAYRWWLRPAAA